MVLEIMKLIQLGDIQMKIQVMIAEDEQLAREEMIYMLKKEKNIILCPSAESGEQLLELYFEHKPDVLFLDIEMPGMTGIEAAKQIVESSNIPPLFIFTTAYDHYTLDAFEVEAIDYLLKPFDNVRLHQAVERIRKRLVEKAQEPIEAQISEKDVVPAKLLIDDGEKMVVLSPEEIYYAVPAQRMLEIHTLDKVIESKLTLQELEKKLLGSAFFRTHRSYLVNLNHVLEITPWFNGAYNITLTDKDKTTIPVSRSARKELFKQFDN